MPMHPTTILLAGAASLAFAVPSIAQHAGRADPPGGQVATDGADADALRQARASRAAQDQIATDAPARAPIVQVYDGPRTARAVDPLSTPAQGRAQRVVRLRGADRCDPGSAAGAAHVDCAKAIERRADDYDSPAAPVLTAEQTLMIDQQSRESDRVRLRTRAADGDIGNPDSAVSQMVASQLLPPGAPAADDRKSAAPVVDSTTAGVIAAIVSAAQNGGK